MTGRRQGPQCDPARSDDIGHLEAAAGIAGLIKVVLVLNHQLIPPHLHLGQVNPHLPPEGPTLWIAREPTPWPADGRQRFAGVSSFGFGGTNAHVVVGESPRHVAGRDVGPERPEHVLTLSARTDVALKELARRFRDHLAEHPDARLADVCFTANTGRALFAYRLAVTAGSSVQMGERLSTFLGGTQAAGIARGRLPGAQRPGVRFLLTGLDPPPPRVGRELYDTQPAFRSSLDRCAELLRPHLPRPLLSLLDPAPGEGPPSGEPGGMAPAQFAFEYALAELWRSWGVEPDAVTGQGLGEYTAACLAGVLTLEEAVGYIAEQGRLVRGLRGGDSLAGMLEPWRGRLRSTAPRIPLISALADAKSEPARAPVVCGTQRQSGEAVQFDPAIRTLTRLGHGLLLAIGPRPTLLTIGQDSRPESPVTQSPVPQQSWGDWRGVLETLAALFAHGMTPDWAAFDRGYLRTKVPPTPRPAGAVQGSIGRIRPATAPGRSDGQTGEPHPLLGRRIS